MHDEKKETTRYLLLLNFNELSLLLFKFFFVFIQEPTYKKDHSSSFPHDTINDKCKVPCKINYHRPKSVSLLFQLTIILRDGA